MNVASSVVFSPIAHLYVLVIIEKSLWPSYDLLEVGSGETALRYLAKSISTTLSSTGTCVPVTLHCVDPSASPNFRAPSTPFSLLRATRSPITLGGHPFSQFLESINPCRFSWLIYWQFLCGEELPQPSQSSDCTIMNVHSLPSLDSNHVCEDASKAIHASFNGDYFPNGITRNTPQGILATILQD